MSGILSQVTDTQRLTLLGRTVRRVREAAGLTQAQAASLGDIAKLTWGKVELGKPVASASYAGVDRALGWPLAACEDFLLHGKDLPVSHSAPSAEFTELGSGIRELHSRPEEMRDRQILQLRSEDDNITITVLTDKKLTEGMTEELEKFKERVSEDFARIEQMARMQRKLEQATGLPDLAHSDAPDRTC